MECQADMPGNATVVIVCVLVHAIAYNNVFNLCLFCRCDEPFLYVLVTKSLHSIWLGHPNVVYI